MSEENYKVSATCQVNGLNEIYKKYFGYPSEGFFVEVGAFDGESFSNTSCLADHGWSGIYVEPVEEHYEACLRRHDKNDDIAVVQCAIGSTDKVIDLYVGGPLTTSDPEQVKRYSEIDWAQHIPFSKRTEVEQVTLDELLDYFDLEPGQVDLVTVDVEGREADVFEGFSLGEWAPKMLIVELEDEHESFQKYQDHVAVHRELREKIVNTGYVEIYKDHINTIFVHEKYYQDIEDQLNALLRQQEEQDSVPELEIVE